MLFGVFFAGKTALFHELITSTQLVSCLHFSTLFSLTFSPVHFLWAGMCIYIIDLFNAWLTILPLFCISNQPFLNKVVYQWVTLTWGLSSISLWRQFISSNFQVNFWHSSSPHIHAPHGDKLAPLLLIITQNCDSEQEHGWREVQPCEICMVLISVLVLQCEALCINYRI